MAARCGQLPRCPPAPLPSGILYRMAPSGHDFEVLYTFSQTDANGDNMDGADCYEPLVETKPGVFYGTATLRRNKWQWRRVPLFAL